VLTGLLGWPAGIGDVVTGLFAVPAAVAVVTGTAQGRRAAIIWNIFGLADFAVAITMGAITSSGPFQLIVPDVLSIGAAGAYPDVLSPACQARSCCTRCRCGSCTGESSLVPRSREASLLPGLSCFGGSQDRVA
jgi:hypothetical protein